MIRSVILGLYLLATACAGLQIYDIPRHSVDGLWYLNYASEEQKVDACGILNTMDYCKCLVIDNYDYDKVDGLDTSWVSVMRGYDTRVDKYQLTLWKMTYVPNDEEKAVYKVNYVPGKTFVFTIVGSDTYDHWVVILTDKTFDTKAGNSTQAAWLFSKDKEMDPSYKAEALEAISKNIDLDPGTLVKIDHSDCPPLVLPS